MTRDDQPRRILYYTRIKPSKAELAKLRKRTATPEGLIEEAHALAVHYIGDADDERRHDALEILVRIGDVEAGRRTGDINQTLVAAYWLGRYVERLGIWRPVERLAVIGDESTGGAKRGGARKRLAETEKERRRREWAPVVEELRKKHPGLTIKAIREKAGLRLGVSGETVRRALKKIIG